MRRRITRFTLVTVLVVGVSALIAACTGGQATPTTAPTKALAAAPTTAPAATAVPTKAAAAVSPTAAASPATSATASTGALSGGSTLTAARTSAAPKIDADPSDADWGKAQAATIKVAGGGGLSNGSTDVSLKALYDHDRIYFLMQYADPTQSLERFPWVKQADGTWKQTGDTSSGDAKANYEDKFAMLWNIDDSIKGFNQTGCMVTCHLGESKPYGNKYTAAPGEKGDIWHMKTVRTGSVGQVDDQWLDDTRYDKDKAPEAGRKSDANTGGGYKDNISQDKKTPAYGAPDNKPAPPFWIEDSKKVPFDDSKYKANDKVAGVTVAPYQGDRGDINAAMSWKDGRWTYEFSRKLDTGSQTDVQFKDLNKGYFFGVAIFDDVQVRHAFENGATQLVFAK